MVITWEILVAIKTYFSINLPRKSSMGMKALLISLVNKIDVLFVCLGFFFFSKTQVFQHDFLKWRLSELNTLRAFCSYLMNCFQLWYIIIHSLAWKIIISPIKATGTNQSSSARSDNRKRTRTGLTAVANSSGPWEMNLSWRAFEFMSNHFMPSL